VKQFARNLDNLGRIVLPKEICKANGIDPGDLLEITVISDGILLTPRKAYCSVCGAGGNLLQVGESAICADCAHEVIKANKLSAL